MPNQTIPLQLPDAIYQRLQKVAHATNHSIEEADHGGRMPASHLICSCAP